MSQPTSVHPRTSPPPGGDSSRPTVVRVRRHRQDRRPQGRGCHRCARRRLRRRRHGCLRGVDVVMTGLTKGHRGRCAQPRTVPHLRRLGSRLPPRLPRASTTEIIGIAMKRRHDRRRHRRDPRQPAVAPRLTPRHEQKHPEGAPMANAPFPIDPAAHRALAISYRNDDDRRLRAAAGGEQQSSSTSRTSTPTTSPSRHPRRAQEPAQHDRGPAAAKSPTSPSTTISGRRAPGRHPERRQRRSKARWRAVSTSPTSSSSTAKCASPRWSPPSPTIRAPSAPTLSGTSQWSDWITPTPSAPFFRRWTAWSCAQRQRSSGSRSPPSSSSF